MRIALSAAVGIAIAIAVAVALSCAAAAQEPTPEAHARPLFVEGQRLYDLGEYDLAVAKFKEAYRLSGRPLLLFNVAQAYRQMRACSDAARFYRAYLQAYEAAPERPEIEAELVELDRCAAQARAREPVAPPAPRPAQPPRAVRTEEEGASWPPFVTIAGIGVAVAGAIVYGIALNEFERLHDECAPLCATDDWEGWQTAMQLSVAVVAVGAAAAAVGAAFWVLGGSSDEGEPRAQVAFGVGSVFVRGEL